MTGTSDMPSAVAGDTVLLVGSGRSDVARLACALEDRGLGVLVPERVIEALAFASAARPGVVLLDLRMPDLRLLCRRLRDDPRCGHPSVVLLVPRGVTPVSPAAWGDDVEIVEWDTGDPAPAVDRVVAATNRQRGLRAASPLTGLPGNEAIRAELDRRLAGGEPVALLYADLDGFKAYNDRYGFLRGDQVIRTVADLLSAEARHHPGAFVGHIGGDDFVMLVPPADADAAAHRVVAAFGAVVPSMYAPADAARGWISERDRLGRRRRWPLVSLSIGIARSDQRPVSDALELVDVATEMKRVAKKVHGGAVAADRRQETAGRPGPRAVGALLLGPARRLATVATTVAVAALLFVPAGSALAAARPGDMLWPAARLFEDMRLAIAGSETAVTLHLRLASDRLADAIVALDTGEERAAAESLAEFRRHNQRALAMLAVIDPSARHTMRLQLLEAQARQAAVLATLLADRCAVDGEATSACVALRDALDAIQPGATPTGTSPAEPTPEATLEPVPGGSPEPGPAAAQPDAGDSGDVPPAAGARPAPGREGGAGRPGDAGSVGGGGRGTPALPDPPAARADGDGAGESAPSSQPGGGTVPAPPPARDSDQGSGQSGREGSADGGTPGAAERPAPPADPPPAPGTEVPGGGETGQPGRQDSGHGPPEHVPPPGERGRSGDAPRQDTGRGAQGEDTTGDADGDAAGLDATQACSVDLPESAVQAIEAASAGRACPAEPAR